MRENRDPERKLGDRKAGRILSEPEKGTCAERDRRLRENKGYFAGEREKRGREIEKLLKQTQRGFSFVEAVFGDSQEMVLFVSGLTQDDKAMTFSASTKVLCI